MPRSAVMAERTRILFFASNPLRDVPVAVDVEARAIQEQIDLAQARHRFDLTVIEAPRVTDLLREGAEHRPQIIHFTGHGSTKDLTFLDRDDQPMSISVPALVQLARQLGDDDARVVVLNYCASAEAAQAIVDDAAGRIACAVGTRAPIPDRQAIAFAAAFYGAIAGGRSVARAFAEGNTQVALVGGKADAFTIAVRVGVDADALTPAPEEELRAMAAPPPPPEEPPPAPASAARSQLRSPPADFTGRVKELADVRALFGEAGVLVSGQGGVGKTALALELCRALGDAYPDAQIDVGLRGSGPEPLTPEAAMTQVIHAFDPLLKLPEGPDAVAGIYRATLRGRRALVLLDDAAGPDQIAKLLPPPGSFVVVTGWTWFVVPGIAPYDLSEMTPADATALARRIASRLREDEAGELAARCGYLPLSVRAAAGTLARRRDLRPARYLEQLRSAPERVKLVEAVFREGVDMLAPPLREAWAQLSVFPADFEGVCAAVLLAVDPDRGAEILSEILQRNLLEWDEASGRYRMHDLARDFARLRLDAGALGAANLRFAEHYANVAGYAAQLHAAGGDTLREGLALFDLERQNIQAALAWSLDHAAADPRVDALLLRFVAGSAPLLALREHARDRVAWFTAAAAAARRAGDDAALESLLAGLEVAEGEASATAQIGVSSVSAGASARA